MRSLNVLLGVVLLAMVVQCTGPAKPAPSPLPRAAAQPGLVGWWRFEERRLQAIARPGEALDQSGLRAHGQVVEAKRVNAKHGDAMLFDRRRSRVQIPCTPELNLANAITLEAWICPQSESGASRIIVSKNDEYALRIDNPREGGRISFFVHVGAPAVTWEPRVSSKEPPATNQWLHVVAVWDGSESRLFLDAALVSSRPRAGKPNPNPYPVMIGNWEYPSCHGTRFGGLIDEVRIYNRALTPAEIKTRYLATR